VALLTLHELFDVLVNVVVQLACATMSLLLPQFQEAKLNAVPLPVLPFQRTGHLFQRCDFRVRI
jgi:hypothetical protein